MVFIPCSAAAKVQQLLNKTAGRQKTRQIRIGHNGFGDILDSMITD